MSRPDLHPRVVVAISLGAKPWVALNGGLARYYLNDWASLIGIEVERYNTGNISSASFNGQTVSNGKARDLLVTVDKIWLNEDGVLYMKSYGEPKLLSCAAILELIGDALDERAEASE